MICGSFEPCFFVHRAAGKKSYEKLLVFYYALAAANLPQLAKSAKLVLNQLGHVVDVLEVSNNGFSSEKSNDSLIVIDDE